MFPERIPRWAVAVVVVLVLVGIGPAVHHAGWSQGFAMGLMSANAEGGAAVPYAAYGPRFGPHHGFGFFGGFLRFLFFFFLIGLIFRFFAFRRWQRFGLHGPHGRWGRHEGPPWWRHHDRPTDESDKTEAEEAEARRTNYI
jgi:hypothetical protein